MVNFTFVPHRGARPERRELVKSHVMRESQRKRREAKQRQKQIESGIAQNPDLVADLSSAGGSQASIPVPVNVPQNETDETDEPDQAPELEHDLIVYNQDPQDLNEISPNLIRQPSLLYPTFIGDKLPSDAEWMSQSLFDRVNECLSYYTSTLYIEGPDLPRVSPVVSWGTFAFFDPKILFSVALFYCAYRDTIRQTTGNDHHYFSTRLLRLINKAMQDPVTAVAEDTMSAVLGMCMYENIRGPDLVATHLKGLRQMVELRGGINNLGTGKRTHWTEMIILQDAIRAICSNTPPFMFDISGPILRDSYFGKPEPVYQHSPLRTVEIGRCPGLPPELQSSFDTLNDAWEGFEMVCSESLDLGLGENEVATFRVRRETFWKRLVEVEEGLDKELDVLTTEKKTQLAILYAAKIHYRACALKIQHDDAANEEDMKKLHDVIRKIDVGFWRIAHYGYLWVLFTGGAAAHNHPGQRPFFVSEIMRLGLSIGMIDWRSFRQTMGNFIWLQQRLRRIKMDGDRNEDG